MLKPLSRKVTTVWSLHATTPGTNAPLQHIRTLNSGRGRKRFPVARRAAWETDDSQYDVSRWTRRAPSLVCGARDQSPRSIWLWWAGSRGGRGRRGEFGAGSGACWVITDDLERIMLESMFRQELWIVSAPAGRMLGRDVFFFFFSFLPYWMPIRSVISSHTPPFLSLEADYVAHLYFKQASSVGFCDCFVFVAERHFFFFFLEKTS